MTTVIKLADIPVYPDVRAARRITMNYKQELARELEWIESRLSIIDRSECSPEVMDDVIEMKVSIRAILKELRDPVFNVDITALDLYEEEQIADNVYALRVPGGWVVTIYSSGEHGVPNISSCFVPYAEEKRS